MKPVIREAKEPDTAYVMAAWCRTAYDALEAECGRTKRGRPPAYGLYRTLFGAVQEKLLKRSKVLVAVNPEDTEQIFGCIVYEPVDIPVVHFAASKTEFAELEPELVLYEHIGAVNGKSVIHSGTLPPRRGSRGGLQTLPPKSWTYLPFGLMP